MPAIRNLVTPKTAEKNLRETISAPEKAVKHEAALATLPNAPAWLTAAPQMDPVSAGGSNVTYVGQAHTRSGGWMQQQAAKCSEGDWFVSLKGRITPLKPLKFFLLDARAFGTKMAGNGDIVEAAPLNESGKAPSGLEEHVVGLVIVETPSGLVPAKVDARKAQTPVFAKMIGAVSVAGTPDFLELGDAHKIAAKFPAPFGRVVGTAVVTPRTGRTNGFRYYHSDAEIAPSGVHEMKSLADAFQDAEFLALLDEAKKAFDERVAKIEKLVK